MKKNKNNKLEKQKEEPLSENELILQEIVRVCLQEIDRIGTIKKTNPEGGDIRTNKINRATRVIINNLKDQVKELKATKKASTFEL